METICTLRRRADHLDNPPRSVGALRPLDARSRASRLLLARRPDFVGTDTSLQTHWEAGEAADSAEADSPKDAFTGATGTAKVAGAPKSDESDPLGLMRGGILA